MKCIEDQIPFAIPESWAWARLGSVCYDFQYGTSRKSLTSGVVAVLRMGNLQEGEIDYEDLAYTSNKEDITKYLLDKNEILFNRTNSSEWVGKTAIYRGDIPAIFAGYLVKVSPILVNPHYLNYLMNSGYHRNICLHVKTDGVNQSNISARKLSSFLFAFPPAAEQLRIVNAIDSILEHINTINTEETALATLVTRTKTKILDLAIRGQLVPQDQSDEPASVLLERIQAKREELTRSGTIKQEKKESFIFRGDDNSYYEDNKKIGGQVPFEIPESWSWVQLGSTCLINPRNNADDDIMAAFVPMMLINEGFVNDFRYKAKPWSEIKMGFTHFKENDVGVAKITPCFENRKSVVFSGLLNNIGAGTTELHIVRPLMNKSLLPHYLLWFFKSNYFISNGVRAFSGAVGQQRIRKDYISSVQIPIPPFIEQQRIVLAIESVFKQLDSTI